MDTKETELEEVRCTMCGSLICRKYKWANTRGILFWCRKCKRNFEINSNSAPVADD